MKRLTDLRAALIGGPFGIKPDKIICRVSDGGAEMPFTGGMSYSLTYTGELVLLDFGGDGLAVLAFVLDWIRTHCPSNKISLPWEWELIDDRTIDLVLRPTFTETVGASNASGGTSLTVQADPAIMDLMAQAFGNDG